MAHPQAAPTLSLPRVLRIYEKVPLQPIWTGVAAAVGLIATYLASCFLLGHLSCALAGDAPAHIYRDIRTAMVTLIGVAFLPTARIYLARATHRHLVELWSSLDADGRKIASERDALGVRSVLAGLAPPLGAALMLLFLLYVALGVGSWLGAAMVE